MRVWQFRQKTPGFGLSKQYYMTVLSGSALLPSIVQVINPKGEGGALEGFGVPLASSATKDDLSQPLKRGAYAISTKDRKTVLKLMVIPKEEAGFDPAPFLRSELAKDFSQELLNRISATWMLLQITIETHEAMVYPTLRFILEFSKRLAELSDGVVADPISQTYKLPAEVFSMPQADARVDARDHVHVVLRTKPEGVWAFTLGMQKFAQPEMEIFGLQEAEAGAAASLLLSLAQNALLGDLVEVGDRIGPRDMPLQVVQGGVDRGAWEGIPCLELLPPTGKSAGEAVIAALADQ